MKFYFDDYSLYHCLLIKNICVKIYLNKKKEIEEKKTK